MYNFETAKEFAQTKFKVNSKILVLNTNLHSRFETEGAGHIGSYRLSQDFPNLVEGILIYQHQNESNLVPLFFIKDYSVHQYGPNSLILYSSSVFVGLTISRWKTFSAGGGNSVRYIYS